MEFFHAKGFMSGGFFDTHSKLTAKGAAAGAAPSPAGTLTVTQLTKQIDRAIKAGVPASVLVQGQISNYRPPRGGAGHLYFTLKDAAACIDCVLWADAAARLRFTPADGLEVIASGRVAVYADRGKYQLYVNTLSPLGKGTLELAFQELRAKLEKEGLFEAARKKPLPQYPLNISIVTSSAAAALQDMLKVLRRFAWLRLHLCDVPVQGENAAGKIAAAIKELNAGKRPVDVILLARGGGSLEDLWAFNEEIVARAVAASAIPIVTGIGHEVDVSIADLVADHHTHTPTEAAQAVTARWRNARDLIDISHTRLRRGLRQLVETARQRLIAIRRHEVFRRPLDRVIALRQLLDDRQRALTLAAAGAMRGRAATLAALEGRWAQRHPRQVVALRRAQLDSLKGALEKAVRDDRRRRETKLDALAAHLRAVGPQEVLRRGYSITARKKDGTIIRAAEQVKPGDVLVTRLADGSIESVAGDPKQPTLF